MILYPLKIASSKKKQEGAIFFMTGIECKSLNVNILT